MRADVLWHRVRGHTVVRGHGNATITRVFDDGGFGFQVPPAFKCACGVQWCSELDKMLERTAQHRESFGFRRRTRG